MFRELVHTTLDLIKVTSLTNLKKPSVLKKDVGLLFKKGEKMPIQISAKRDGFRRCGIAHTSSPLIYPDDRFTLEELEILKKETMLNVVILKPAEFEPAELEPASKLEVEEKPKKVNQKSRGKRK